MTIESDLSFPAAVLLPDTSSGFRVVPWDEFAADNDPDITRDIAEQIASKGYARIGGGAAEDITIHAAAQG